LVNPSGILAEYSSLQFIEINQPANQVGRRDSEFFWGKKKGVRDHEFQRGVFSSVLGLI
jgi:hypothetical protein